MTVPLSQAATVSGTIAPALYGLLFISFGIARTLRTPYGGHWQRSCVQPRQLKRWIEGVIGACIGGITGATFGVLLGYLLILLVYGFMCLMAHSFQTQTNLQLVDLTIYRIGFLGSTIGLLTGLGLINWQCFNERIINLSRHLFFVHQNVD
jgi:hypothetical protein